MAKVIKTFDVEEGSVRGGWYKIIVRSNGKVVDSFKRETMKESRRAFHAAGYQFIAWAEGSRIVCQKEE
ncbi:MAG: hypothetical protein Q7S34_02480 [bacterium]|nr:hypothetical protein [bacterium]